MWFLSFVFAEPGINVTAPTVRVLKPCKSQKGNKTLVCVASGFYPDHVSVSWEIDDVVVNKKLVATDNAAVREDKYYNITSLLRVSEEEWYTEGKKFHCAVRFYDGSDYIYRNKTVLGNKSTFFSNSQKIWIWIFLIENICPDLIYFILLSGKQKVLMNTGKYSVWWFCKHHIITYRRKHLVWIVVFKCPSCPFHEWLAF